MLNENKRPNGTRLQFPRLNLHSSESWLFVFICMVWVNTSLGDFARVAFMRIPILGAYDGFPATRALYAICLIPALPAIFRAIKKSKLIFPLVAVCVYLLTYVLFPENETHLNENAATFFLTVLPAYALGLAWDVDKTAKPLYYVSIVALICCVIFSFIKRGDGYGYDMVMAYAVLPHLCLIAYNALTNFGKFNALLTGGGAVFLAMQGTRGPLLCFFVFVALSVLFAVRTRNRLAIVSLSLIFMILTLGGNLTNSIISELDATARNLNLSTRIFEKFLENDLATSQGRDEIREFVFKALQDSQGAWGYGLFGDRVLLGVSELGTSNYAHNLALELWINFGVVIGSALLILIAVLFFWRYKISKTQSERAFVLLLACCTIGHLTMSSSYLTHGLFFAFLGICAQSQKDRRYGQNPPVFE